MDFRGASGEVCGSGLGTGSGRVGDPEEGKRREKWVTDLVLGEGSTSSICAPGSGYGVEVSMVRERFLRRENGEREADLVAITTAIVLS